MKIYSILIILLIFLSCKTSKIKEAENLDIKGDCVENLTFKNTYFKHIAIIDSMMYNGPQNIKFKKFVTVYF